MNARKENKPNARRKNENIRSTWMSKKSNAS